MHDTQATRDAEVWAPTGGGAPPPMTAAEGVAFAKAGISAWRDGLAVMTDEDLDIVGRSAYPDGLDPELPLIEIVWWISNELLFHAGEIWFVRDLYAHYG